MINTPQKNNPFLLSLKTIQHACKQENLKNPDNPIVYEVIQLSDLVKPHSTFNSPTKQDTPDIYISKIAQFYNDNWLGNPEFMHTPDYRQVLINYMKCPMIIAREKQSDEILAISTIKYNENSKKYSLRD